MPSVDEVRQRLGEISLPGFRHSITRYGVVQDVDVSDGDVTVRLVAVTRRADAAQELQRRIEESLRRLPDVRSVRVESTEAHAHPGAAAAAKPAAIPGIRRIVAVSSAKGGVGKSTVAVNLAIALRSLSRRVALMDADVYGPSVPIMMGIDARPQTAGRKVVPLERYGVSLMSMGFFLDDKSPVIWRGPMVMGLIRQFLHDVEWGEQDYLVVDMPPGTGDAALTLAQQVPLSGAVIVTTPQEVALQDVERGIAMFRQVHVPVLGIVENMSVYECPECGEREDIFGSGGAESLGRQFGTPVLARLPLVPAVRIGGDIGRPVVVTDPDHPVSSAFRDLAGMVDRLLSAAEGTAA